MRSGDGTITLKSRIYVVEAQSSPHLGKIDATAIEHIRLYQDKSISLKICVAFQVS